MLYVPTNNFCLLFRKDNGEFEALDLSPYSSPPDLPDVMKSQETNGQEQVHTILCYEYLPNL